MTTFLIVAAVSGLAFGGMAILQAVALQKQVEELVEERDLARVEVMLTTAGRDEALRRLREVRRQRDAALPTPKWPGDAA